MGSVPSVVDRLTVEVVFALPHRQELVSVSLEAGATVRDAIRESGLTQKFPDENLEALPTGIWGRTVDRDEVLNDGDRVEIYRPLEVDPREARRQRVS